MKPSSQAMALLLLLQASASAFAVQKCTLPDGKVVYQQAACPLGQAASHVNVMGAGAAQPNAPGAQYWQRESARQKRAEQVEAAIAARQILIGMTGAEAIQAWGQPAKINTTVNGSGRSEQWVYRRARGAGQYVYLQDGVVHSIQTSD